MSRETGNNTDVRFWTECTWRGPVNSVEWCSAIFLLRSSFPVPPERGTSLIGLEMLVVSLRGINCGF